MSTPRISVVVATRDRPDMLRGCVESLLASDHESFEVIVADQSVVPTELAADPRLVHLQLASTGKSSALNAGIAQASAPIIAFTDDDCTVPSRWLRKGEAVFERHPGVSLLFGDLKPMEHDPDVLFVPATMLGRFQIFRGWPAITRRGGAGANCFARRALFDVVSGWDEMIGPGSRFPGCEEFDLHYRTATANLSIAYAPAVEVVHWGARAYADNSAEALLDSYAYGEGGVIAKHLCLGDVRIVWHLLKAFAGDALYSLSARDRRGARMSGSRLRGLVDAMTLRVDRKTRVFRRS